jgi:hypothetical protein
MLQVMFVAVADLEKGLRIETLFSLKTEKYVIFLQGTRRLVILASGVTYTEVWNTQN